VEIDVRLPSADAKVWVDGKAMDQTGVVRKFKVSSSGATQTVEVRTEWNEGNSKQERKRVIQVRAGQQVYSNLAIADKDNASPRAE
jgi:uncharacterized protein (TIGR03000 family)